MIETGESILTLADIFTFAYATITTMNECKGKDEEGAEIALHMLLGQVALLNFLKEKGVHFSYDESSRHEELNWLVRNLSRGKRSTPGVKVH